MIWQPPSQEDLARLHCAGCHKTPEEIDEYQPDYTGQEGDPREYVWFEEGTLNRETGQFLCTICYVRAGMPSGPHGWTVPPGWDAL